VAGIKWDNKALDRLLNDPEGDVGRHMGRVGDRILAGAWAMTGPSSGSVGRRLYKTQRRRSGGQELRVGSSSSKAYWYHEGTRPHQIVATVNRLLRFNVGGQVVYAQKVDHPGQRPRPFLTTPMRRVIR